MKRKRLRFLVKFLQRRQKTLILVFLKVKAFFQMSGGCLFQQKECLPLSLLAQVFQCQCFGSFFKMASSHIKPSMEKSVAFFLSLMICLHLQVFWSNGISLNCNNTTFNSLV